MALTGANCSLIEVSIAIFVEVKVINLINYRN